MSPPLPARLRPRNVRALALVLLGLVVAAAPFSPAVRAASQPAVRGVHGMVVTPEAHASEVGREVLRRGGNAIDAGVAVAFTLAVSYPLAGNLGGGGFLIYRSPDGEHFALDFRETAPAALLAEAFLDEEGRPIPGLSLNGGLAVGVPGAVAGLAEAHARWGTRPWRELVRPAIRLAAKGLPVSSYEASRLARASDKLLADPEARAIFARGGNVLAPGAILVQRDLAAALRRIARHGRDGFYRGPVADALIATVRRTGGVMTAEDLAAYRPQLRKPMVGTYRGYRLICFPPPSSGGVVLLQALAMLERYDLRASGAGSSLTVHRMAEAERRAFADRSQWLGDPAFFESPLAGLLESGYVAGRAATIDDDRATPSADLRPGNPRTHESTDTLHLSVADARGGAVTMTTTLNGPYGTGIVAAGTGILLNNQIDDFALAPGMPNTYGLLGGEANAVAGGKRPLSSMTPTIVETPGGGGRPWLVLGSPGGSQIITSVLQVLVNVIDHQMPLQEAVDAARFHHQWYPDEILVEERGFAADVARALEARGHRIVQSDRPMGNVNAIGIDADGAWLGAADPRRHGNAAGY